MKVLAIIPARGGSKGVHRKNIRFLGGRPLISYCIGTALNCAKVDRVMVSTEDSEIAEIAREWGAEVPCLRPAEMAADDSRVVDSVLHAMEWTKREEGYVPDRVMLLQPTSPFVASSDIDAAVELSAADGIDGVVSVCEADPPPFWMHKLGDDSALVDFEHTVHESRRQDLRPVFGRNGAIFLTKTSWMIKHETFFHGKVLGYVMDQERSLDINTETDFVIGEAILSRRGTVS